uniref:Uncharacterized protein n=1 Tax=Candidatus Kentrum sp. LFY TaxID=2126342 RepID=A0A450WRE7_9GAMM|nr:MAG: hypothetical protein BECKLFY1418C_GA0070996_106017 [Candidatus Kentron sp. LFY]
MASNYLLKPVGLEQFKPVIGTMLKSVDATNLLGRAREETTARRPSRKKNKKN